MKRRLCFILVGLVTLSAFSATAEGRTLRGKVVKVVDGDTVKVKVGKRTKTFDLAGVDAPELTGDAAATCFGKEAKARLAALLRKRAKVKLRTAGRTAQVFRGRRSINRALVRSGHARALDGGGKLGARLRKDEESAKSQGLGLHGACAQAPTGTPPPTGTDPGPGTTDPGTGTTDPGTQPAPGDVTGQQAIDQMTAELRDMYFARYTSSSNTTYEYHLHLCGDGRFRYYTQESYSSDGTFFNVRNEDLGENWHVTEALIHPNGDRGAIVKGTITSHATGSGPGQVQDPNAEMRFDNVGGQWYANGEPAQANPGAADCNPILQHF